MNRSPRGAWLSNDNSSEERNGTHKLLKKRGSPSSARRSTEAPLRHDHWWRWQSAKRAFAWGALLHVPILAAIAMNPMSATAMLLWLLAGVIETCLWVPLLVTIGAVVRKRLLWWDPLVLLQILLFGISAPFLAAYSLDPDYVRRLISYESSLLTSVSEVDLALGVVGAQTILGVFLLTVTIISRKGSAPQTPVRLCLHRAELSRIAWMAAAAFLVALWAFWYQWQGRSFVTLVIRDMGTNREEAIVEEGQARFSSVQDIGFALLPLGLGSWLLLRNARRYGGEINISLPEAAVLLVPLLPLFLSGSRSVILFSAVAAAAQVAALGVRFRRWHLAGGVALAIVVLTAVTVLRGNPVAREYGNSISPTPDQLVLEYRNRKATAIGPLLDLDRVTVLVFVQEALSTIGPYSYGETLVAGPLNLLNGVLEKAAGRPWPSEPRWLAGNNATAVWRLGTTAVRSSVPPSVPGELFMQAGWLALPALCAVFALGFEKVRQNAFRSSSIQTRWLWLVVGLNLAKSVTVETSTLASLAIFVYAPIIVLLKVAVGHFRQAPSGREVRPLLKHDDYEWQRAMEPKS